MKLSRRQAIFFLQLFIIAVFILSLITAIRFKKTFQDARNLIRLHHLEAIMDAVYTYYIVHHTFPDCIPLSGAVKIQECQEIEPFLTKLPKDPSSDGEYFIEYFGPEKNNIRVFSTSKEALGLEIIR